MKDFYKTLNYYAYLFDPYQHHDVFIITESELYITKKIFTVGDRLVFQAETPMTGGELDVERSFDFNNWEKVKSVASVGLITVVVDMENDKRMFYRLKIVE